MPNYATHFPIINIRNGKKGYCTGFQFLLNGSKKFICIFGAKSTKLLDIDDIEYDYDRIPF